MWVIVCWSLYLATCLDCFAYKYLENVLSVEELMEDMQEAIKSELRSVYKVFFQQHVQVKSVKTSIKIVN